MKLSVVCVYNKPEVLASCLVHSLASQDLKHERILLDNTQNSYSSASVALNEGGNRATGDYILFSHQDMIFSGSDWLSRLVGILDTIVEFGIAGLAGKRDSRGVRSNLITGVPIHPAGDLTVKHPERVQTLDECLFVIPKGIFQHVQQFDERTCKGWHLYCVDYCLSIRKKGYSAYVLPLYAYHASTGESPAPGLRNSLEYVLSKHRGHSQWVYSTVGDWHTSLSVRQNEYLKKVIGVVKKGISFNGRPQP